MSEQAENLEKSVSLEQMIALTRSEVEPINRMIERFRAERDALPRTKGNRKARREINRRIWRLTQVRNSNVHSVEVEKILEDLNKESVTNAE